MSITLLNTAHARLVRLLTGCLPLALFSAILTVSPAAIAESAVAVPAPPNDAALDAILLELKAIRQVLEKIEKQGSGKAQRSNKPTNAKVSIKGRQSMGAADAPVTVVEFADYQCPFCLRFTKTTFPLLMVCDAQPLTVIPSKILKSTF